MMLPQLNPSELATRAGAEGFLLLDVREPWEVQTAHIDLPGTQALHIPMHLIPLRLAEVPRTQPIACICHHGARSAQVVAYLRQQGFDGVYNLAGGIDGWSVHVDPAVPRY